MITPEIIKKRRKELGLTQKELAKGVTSDTMISLIENGRSKIPPYLINILKERLQIKEESPEDLRHAENMKHHSDMIEQAWRHLLNYEFDCALETSQKARAYMENTIHMTYVENQQVIEQLVLEMGIELQNEHLDKFDKDRRVKRISKKLETLSIREYKTQYLIYRRLIGQSHQNKGDLKKAINEYIQIITHPDDSFNVHTAVTYFNIAMCYQLMHQYIPAMKYVSKAKIHLEKKENRGNKYIECLIIEGNIYLIERMYDEAIRTFNKGLAYIDSTYTKRFKFILHNNISIAYKQKGDYIASIEYAKEFWEQAEFDKEEFYPYFLLNRAETQILMEHQEGAAESLRELEKVNIDKKYIEHITPSIKKIEAMGLKLKGERRKYISKLAEAAYAHKMRGMIWEAIELYMKAGEESNSISYYKEAHELLSKYY